MARPHTEFIEVKDIVTEPLIDDGSSTGIRVKRLSEDTATEAVSFFAIVPPLWVRLQSGYYESAVEIFIIEGDLHIGEDHLTAGCFSYLPAGAFQGPASSEAGCRLMMLFDGPPSFHESDMEKPGAKENLRIRSLNTNSMEWEVPPAFETRSLEETSSGVFVKWLRVDPETTAYTLMTKHEPGWQDPRPEAHSNWEELYLVEGDYLMGAFGMMTAGGYIFRPENIPHGPQATKTGAVWLARGNKMVDFALQEVPYADDMVRRYMATAHLFLQVPSS